MKHEFFTVPIFTDKVDLDKIKIVDKDQQPTFRSGVMTSLRCEKEVSHETMEHLTEIIKRNIDSLGVKYGHFGIEEIWRNTYTNQDFQDPHIHCYSQWSFIIYEDVDISRTVFLNPYRFRVETQMAMYDQYFCMYLRPELHNGDIIIFPSFVEHYVLSGGTGSTISGNVFLSPPS